MRTWCEAKGRTMGAVVPVQTAHDLGRVWFIGRFDESWTREDPATVAANLARHGLTGEFWDMATEVG